MSDEEKTVKKTYFQQQNIELSFDRIILKGLSGMAQGLFASLLIGTIIKTIGGFIPGMVGEFLVGVAGYTGAVQGAAMALAIGYAMQCPRTYCSLWRRSAMQPMPWVAAAPWPCT